MTYMIWILVIILLLRILNHSNLFRPKIRKNIMQQKYTCTEDLWIKGKNNKKLIVWLHGMFSTPSTFEDVAVFLKDKGYDNYIPTLPASALTVEDLQKIGSWSWRESLIVVREKLNSLDFLGYDQIILGGHSQGGSFALQIASEKEFIDLFAGIIVIASPINLYGNHLKLWENCAIYFSGIISLITSKGIKEHVKNIKERSIIEKKCDVEGIHYPYTIYTFKQGLKELRSRLYLIKAPLLLAYCQGDKLVNVKNLNQIKKNVSSSIVLEKTYDIPREEEPYGFRHQLLNYTKTKVDLQQLIVEFLEMLK